MLRLECYDEGNRYREGNRNIFKMKKGGTDKAYQKKTGTHSFMAQDTEMRNHDMGENIPVIWSIKLSEYAIFFQSRQR